MYGLSSLVEARPSASIVLAFITVSLSNINTQPAQCVSVFSFLAFAKLVVSVIVFPDIPEISYTFS